jgi:hypothetical protein
MNGTKSNVYRDPCGRKRRLTTVPTADNWATLRNYYALTFPFPGYDDRPYPGGTPTDTDPMPDEYFEKLKTIWEPYLGYPYKPGGKTPPYFDCSGFVAYCCKQAGLMKTDVFAYTYTIMLYCEFVQSELLEENGRAIGDILYWSKNPGPDEGMNAHVAIYIGNNYCVESSYNGCAYGPITAHTTTFRGYYRLPRPYPIEEGE